VRIGACHDVDADGFVTATDEDIVDQHQANEGQALYDYHYDLNGDGVVSEVDVTLVAAQASTFCPDTANIKYYWAFGRRIARRSGSSLTPLNPGSISYLLADHLGSTTNILRSGGTVSYTMRYYPYGRMRTSDYSVNDKLFTGQQREMQDTTLNVYNYGARFYSTTLGRFLSADPLMAGSPGLTANLAMGAAQAMGAPASPFSLDRFAYVGNNPLRYTDPTGLCFVNPMTGEMMECSTSQMFRVLVCAHSPASCADLLGLSEDDPRAFDIWNFTNWGIHQTEFVGSYYEWWAYVAGPDKAGQGYPRQDLLGTAEEMACGLNLPTPKAVDGGGPTFEDIVQWLKDTASYAVGTDCGRASSAALAICIGTSPGDPLCEAFVVGAAEVCSMHPEVTYESR